MSGDANGPPLADNAWLTLYDSAAPSRFYPAFAGVGTNTVGGTSTSIAIPLPAGVVAGNVLVAVIGRLDSTGTDPIAAPAGVGWVQANQGECTDNVCTLAIFYLAVNTVPSSPQTFTWTTGRKATGAILRYTGVDTTNPLDVAAAAATGGGSDATAPSVTTATTNTLLLRTYAGTTDQSGGTAAPPNHTLEFNLGRGGSGTDTSSAGADRIWYTAGGAGTGTATFAQNDSPTRWRAATLALRGAPAPAAGAPAAGHWQVVINQTAGGNNLNAFGVRADDVGSPGTEMNVYYDSQMQYGTNEDQTRTYNMFPYITSGCSCSENDFDYDSGNTGNQGQVAFTSRTGAFTQTVLEANLADNDEWFRNAIGATTGWTTRPWPATTASGG